MPLYALRAQVASAIDVIVQMTRFSGGRRAITQVAEVLPLDEQGRYRLHELFTFQPDDAGGGQLAWTKNRSLYCDEPKVRAQTRQLKRTGGIFQTE